jgi:hypothetical protein
MHDSCFNSFSCELCTTGSLSRIYYFYFVFGIYVGVLDIYEQNIVKGAKRKHYGAVTGTMTQPFERWKIDIFHQKIIKSVTILALVETDPCDS